MHVPHALNNLPPDFKRHTFVGGPALLTAHHAAYEVSAFAVLYHKRVNTPLVLHHITQRDDVGVVEALKAAALVRYLGTVDSIAVFCDKMLQRKRLPRLV